MSSGGPGKVGGQGSQWQTNPLYSGQADAKDKTGGTGKTDEKKPTTLKGDKGDVAVKQTKTESKKAAKKAQSGDKKVKAEGGKKKSGVGAKLKKFFSKATPAEKEAKAMAKLRKKMDKVGVSAPLPAQTKGQTSAAGRAAQARELSKPGALGDKAIFGNASSLSPKEADQRAAVKDIFQNCGQTYKELQAADPKAAADFKKDICSLIDSISDMQAENLKGSLKGADKDSMENAKASFLRLDSIDTTMFGKAGGFNSFGDISAGLAKEVHDNPELKRLLAAAKENPTQSDTTFTEGEKKILKDFMDKALTTLANPGAVDKDLAACMTRRNDKMEAAVKDGLKDNKNFTDKEKAATAKHFGTASMHNELALRWMNPSLEKHVHEAKDPEERNALVSLMKGIQTHFNSVSGKTGLDENALSGIADSVRTSSKATFLTEITSGSVPTAFKALGAMSDKILESGR